MAARACLPEGLKNRRNILILWLAVTLVVVLGFLGNRHKGLLLNSHTNDNSQTSSSKSSDIYSPPPPSYDPPPTFSSTKVAVIVETRMVKNLIPLMMHFSAVLGPTWQVVLYAKRGAFVMPTSGPFRRAVDDDRIRVLYLPPNMDMTNYVSVSVFWTRPWIWEQLASADRVLTFQTDSIICSKAPLAADDFLEWDYVGAPVASVLGRGYNGGLSIRNPKKFLDIVLHNDFDSDAMTGHIELAIEDQWFYTKLLERKDSKLPGEDVAKTFSVESVWYDAPLAYHQPHEWHATEMEQIREYCPEVEMIYR